MEDYFAAKALLFDGRAGRASRSSSRRRLGQPAWPRSSAVPLATVTTVGAGGPTGRPWTSRTSADGDHAFRALGPGVDLLTGCALPGRYNVANALLALAILADSRCRRRRSPRRPSRGAPVPGRMERIDAGQPFLAVVDYSHKPAAVEGRCGRCGR